MVRVETIVDALIGLFQRDHLDAAAREFLYGVGSAVSVDPWNRLVGTERHAGYLFPRRGACKTGETDPRRIHTICRPKESANVKERSNILRHKVDGRPLAEA
jgi:hypothetical protein